MPSVKDLQQGLQKSEEECKCLKEKVASTETELRTTVEE